MVGNNSTPARLPLRLLGVLALAGLLVAGIVVNAQSGSNAQPADKVVASGSTLAVIGPNEEVTILTASLKSSSPTDLILTVTMECSIFTQLTTGPSEEGGTDSAMAAGHVRAWVEIDGVIVPINSDSANSAPGTESDKVTFCNRVYQRTVEDAEETLLQPNGDGQDIEDDFIATKDANAFNWLRLNLGSGDHSIVVKATLLQETDGDATAEAAIGNRLLIAEPSKLANNAVI
jgi:hypothetical protein